MIKSITITNHLNESITMNLESPESSGFSILSIDGLGPPKANVEKTEMSLMDGAVYNSARAQSRNIVFSLRFHFPSSTKIEDLRQKSYKYFPLKQRVKIVIETDNRSCETYGYVESNEPSIFSKESGTTISVICPSSYLLSTQINSTEFASIDPLFEFPFSNESLTEKLLEFSEISGYTTNAINYTGDVEIGLVMYIHAVGNVVNPEIFKLEPGPSQSIKIDTDRLLALTGEGIHSGDDIIISTIKGSKYAILIRDGVITNILNCLEKYPDWFQLSRGDNIFTYTAESGQLNLQFKIENQVAYEGI
jgi:hypothetical protein